MLSFVNGAPSPTWLKRSPQRQRARRLLEDQSRFPGVGHVRRVDPADTFANEIENLPVGKDARRSVGEIVQRHHAGGRAMRHLRVRSGGQPVVHRAALVGLEVAE